MAKTAIARPPNPLAALAALASQPAAKKDSKPVVRSAALEGPIKTFIAADATFKEAEARRKQAEAVILEAAAPLRIAACRQEGELHASVLLNDRLTMTAQCRYSAVPADRVADLQAAFGDSFDGYFKDTLAVEMTEAAVGDEALIGALMKALGSERFAKAFTVTRTMKPTAAFHNDYTLKPAVENLAAPFIQDQTIKSAKPSLRIA